MTSIGLVHTRRFFDRLMGYATHHGTKIWIMASGYRKNAHPRAKKKEVTLGIISEIYARFWKLSQKSYLFSFARDVRRIEERIGDRLG